MQAGEVIVLQETSKVPKGWQYGEILSRPGTVGFFPESYCVSVAVDELSQFLEDDVTLSSPVHHDHEEEEVEVVVSELDDFLAEETAEVASRMSREEVVAYHNEEEEERRSDYDNDDDNVNNVNNDGYLTRVKWALSGDDRKKQLKCHAGEELRILRWFQELGWCLAERQHGDEAGERGFVPCNYVESAPPTDSDVGCWRVGEVVMAHVGNGVWEQGTVMEGGQRHTQVRMEDGTERTVASLAISTPPRKRQEEQQQQHHYQQQRRVEQQKPAVANVQMMQPMPQVVKPALGPMPQVKPIQQQPAPVKNVKQEPVAASSEDALWAKLQQKAMTVRSGSSVAASNSGHQRRMSEAAMFRVGEIVWVEEEEDKWERGEVVGLRANNAYEVIVEKTGRMIVRSEHQLRPCNTAPSLSSTFASPVAAMATSSAPAVVAQRRLSAGPSNLPQPQLPQPQPQPALVHTQSLSSARRGSISAPTTSPTLQRKEDHGVAKWGATQVPQTSSGKPVVGGSKSSNVPGVPEGRVVSDAPCAVYTVSGNKRTVMMHPDTTAQQVVEQYLERLGMEREAKEGHVVLTSVVRDDVTIVQQARPLMVSKKWPLIVSTNKNEIPKCRFVIRCTRDATQKLKDLLGEPLAIVGLKTV